MRGHTEERQSWRSETHTFLSSHCPPEHPQVLLFSALKTNILLGSSKFSGVLFSLLGALPWPPPKCLLQMFIFINVAYTGQEIRRGVSQRHLRKHFGTLLRKSLLQEAALDRVHLFSDLLSPLPSRSHCSFYLQSEAPWSSEPKASFLKSWWWTPALLLHF